MTSAYLWTARLKDDLGMFENCIELHLHHEETRLGAVSFITKY